MYITPPVGSEAENEIAIQLQRQWVWCWDHGGAAFGQEVFDKHMRDLKIGLAYESDDPVARCVLSLLRLYRLEAQANP